MRSSLCYRRPRTVKDRRTPSPLTELRISHLNSNPPPVCHCTVRNGQAPVLPLKESALFMGEHKSRASAKLKTDRSRSRKMSSSSSSGPPNTAVTIVRCPSSTLRRLRHLKEREVVTLFTPVVPHPPSTTLAKDMDPFEPLGRALPGLVRHVPYRLDIGMTETHQDHLTSAGAVIVVICATENVTSPNPGAFEKQTRFARDLLGKVQSSSDLADVPVVVLLVTNGAGRHGHDEALKGFPVLVTCEDYTPRPLEGAVHTIFGK